MRGGRKELGVPREYGTLFAPKKTVPKVFLVHPVHVL